MILNQKDTNVREIAPQVITGYKRAKKEHRKSEFQDT